MSALEIETASGRRAIDLDGLLEPEAVQRADVAANQWIKHLRHAQVGGASLRDRFTHRGDSLWWFTEIYLHKMRVITRAFRAVAALEHLWAARILAHAGSWMGPMPSWGMSRRHSPPATRSRCDGHCRSARTVPRRRHASKGVVSYGHGDGRSAAIRIGARHGPVRVAAFVHSAFVGGASGDESYVGPVLRALYARVPGDVRWSGLAHGPISACADGAIVCGSS